MSKSREISYTCPACRDVSPFVVWEEIDAEANPELKGNLLNDSLLRFRCQYCRFQQVISYSILYKDPRQRFVVWWLPADKYGLQKYDPAELNIYARSLPGYRLRMVPALDRLKEKIAIFDSGLDDRAVELLKRYVWSAALESSQVPASQLFFSTSFIEDGHPSIEFYILGAEGKGRVIKVGGPNGYPLILEMMKNHRLSIEEPTRWRTIDHTYWTLVSNGEG